jgi:hypothetical protein
MPDPTDAPCPEQACPHLERYHDERLRSVGQAPCSTCSVCAGAVEPVTPTLLCDPCFEELTRSKPADFWSVG